MNRHQPDLLTDLETPWATSWLPDETLYSLISRSHVISGYARHSVTCERFFGHPTEGSGHDFPARLDAFVHKTRGALGSTEEIIWQRTLLPYYLIFRLPHEREAEINRACAGGLADIKARLGLLASGLGGSHPLKHCPECTREDTQRYGVAYWHRQHQLPGVWICLTHALPLSISPHRSHGTERYLWTLPDVTSSNPRLTGNHFQYLFRLAQYSIQLLDRARSTIIDPVLVASSYATHVINGRRYSPSDLNKEKLSTRIEPYIKALNLFPGHAVLTGEAGLKGFIHVIQGRRGHTHPLRHLILATAFFESIEDYDCPALLAEKSNVIDGLGQDPQTDLKAIVCERIRAGEAARVVARSVGIAVGTAQAWAVNADITIPKRRRHLTEQNRNTAIQLLMAGHDQRKVIADSGIAKGTLAGWMRTEPGLHARWIHARFERQRERSRTSWLDTLQSNPGITITEARQTNPTAMSWLYIHDRSWLQTTNQRMTEKKTVRVERRCWDERDRGLSLAVQKAADTIVSDSDHGTLTRPILYAAMPELKAQLRNLHKLPLTAKVLRRLRFQRNPRTGTQLIHV